MASEQWVTIGERWCECRQGPAQLFERRVIPSGIQQGLQSERVVERRCDCAIECNMAGYPCRWAFTNPENDPFGLI